ncbi:MAG: InlB B-repeat-containing protein, partial [Clostridia bacterium]|nr:InlB B-repeat-containing protein [Clostridia bacterium]
SESGATVELYAQWTQKIVTVTLADLSTENPSYTVTFDLNGASGTAPASQTVTDTVGLTYPTVPTRSGYAFAGWYATSSCTGSPYDFSADVTEDITLYAKWVIYSSSATAISYGDNTININGGIDNYFAFVALTTGSITINVGKQAWIGLSTSASDAGEHDYNTITRSVTRGSLYYIHLESNLNSTSSQYVGSTYLNITGTIRPTAGGKADGVVLVTEQLACGQNFTLGVPTKDGCTFLGWYDGMGGTGTQYTDETGASIRVWDKTEDTTLYARWSTATYIITFDNQGGEGDSFAEIEYGSTLPTISMPTRTGYTFLGYYDDSVGGTQYYDEDAEIVVTDPITESITLYAQWQAKTSMVTLADLSTTNPSHTVTFDLNGATGTAPAPQTVTDTLGLTYPTVPTRNDYVFAGWYATSSCTGSPYDFTAEVTEDITLYARWLSHSGYGTLRVGGNSGSITFPARSSSNYRYYAFVPLVSGSITIYSSSSYDTYGYLFNAVKTQIASDDDSGSGTNFSITYSVTAGELYYIVACAYSTSSSCTGTIYLSGTSTPTAGGKAEGITIVTEQLTYGQNFTLDVPTKVGCSFLGWYDGIGGTGTQYTDQFGASVKTWDKEEDVTLYAKWTESSGNNNTYEADLWDGTIASSFAGGSGTSASPYIIETGEQLAYLASRVNNGTSYSGYYFRLDNNIDLNNINWTPIGMGSTTDGGSYTDYAFSGNFDGNGKNISNLMINTTSLKKAGLFGAIYNATITKVSITEADVYISQNNIISGAILTGTMDNSTITQCFVQGEVEVIDRSSTGSHCANAGAIVGRTIENSRIENCLAQASVSGSMPNKWNAYVGGIAGSESSGTLTISKCAFIGTVYAYGYDDGYAGGILGMREATAYINNSFTVANVSSSDYANAIASPWQDAYPNVTNTYYSSNVTSSKGTSTSTTNFKSQSWLTSTLGWDFADVWTFVEGNDYPVLKAFNN